MTKRDLPALSIVELADLSPAKGSFASEKFRGTGASESRRRSQNRRVSGRIDFATAMSEAEKADVSLPLGGIPIAIKDVINVAGQPCTCASKILRNYRAPYTQP